MAVNYERVTEVLVGALYGYAIAGLLFALAFVTRRVTQMDEQARGTGIAFRILIMPGVIALWPWLFYHWLRSLNMKGETR